MTELSSESLGQLMPAFVKAQAGFPSAPKGKTATVKHKNGGQHSYKYTDLASIVKAFRPLLKEHGLAFTQQCMETQGGVLVRTMLVHESGEWMCDGGLKVPAAANDPQGYGSALTYARRYSLLTVLGVATDDDDGQRAASAPEPVSARAATPVQSNGLTAAERGELIELAVQTGKFTAATAARRIGNLKANEVAKFRGDCKLAIAQAGADA